MKNLLAAYQNGNVSVQLFSDGSKVREFEGAPCLEFPESIDLKITNYCDQPCGFCHEQSNTKGNHADIDSIIPLLGGLPAGVELAIGGGNPLSHPHLLKFLIELQKRGIIANLTVNQNHLQPYREMLETLVNEDLIKGIGVSITKRTIDVNLLPKTSNLVFHVIAGVQNPNILRNLLKLEKDLGAIKVLILGYKEYGLGNKFIESETNNKRVKDNIKAWQTELSRYFGKMIVSFDNLAIKQLNVRKYFNQEGWDRFYMGDDGTFTMYVDAVTKTYAASSVNDRISLRDKNIREAFRILLNDK